MKDKTSEKKESSGTPCSSSTEIPCSVESERAVLSCMLMDSNSAQMALSSLREESFYTGLYRGIFKAMKELAKEGRSIDVVVLSDRLSQREPDENWVRILADIASSIGTSVNIKEYIRVLQEKEYRRATIAAANELKEKAKSGTIEEIVSVLDRQKENYISTGKLLPISEALEKALITVNERIASGSAYSGLRTGFDKLDKMTGGLQDSDLIVIAARPSMGKTALCLDILKNATPELRKNNKCAIFFSLEMSSEQIAMRMYSSALNIRNERFRSGMLKSEDFRKIEKYSDKFLKAVDCLHFNDDMVTGIEDIYMQCHELKYSGGKDIGLIAIDYLQLINTPGDNRNNEIAKITRGLKNLAKTFGCPVIVLSQLSRAVESRNDKHPTLADLRESGSIEQDADVVIFIYRDEYYRAESENKGIADIEIAKQRNGATGRFELRFVKEMTRFENF